MYICKILLEDKNSALICFMILTIRKYLYLRGVNKVTLVYYKEKIDFKNQSNF